VQHGRYVARAEPTERLLQTAMGGEDFIPAACFPYSPYVANYALRLVFPERPALRFEHSPEAALHPAAADFCNSTAQGARYPVSPIAPQR
jgi:hypothetical protein